MREIYRTSARQRPLSLCIAHENRESDDLRRRGGDFFAAVRNRNGCTTLVVGDASAKTAEGYHHAHVLKQAFRMAALEELKPSAILESMSSVFMKAMRLCSPAEKFAAVFVAHIDTEKRLLQYASAGVEGGLIFRCLSSHEHLGATGSLLGIDERAKYGQRSIGFFPGNILLAYTDGVTETRSATSSLPLGTHGLAKLLRRASRLSLAPTHGDLLKHLDRFAGGVYNDDATLVCVTAVEANQF